jgi:hypothetical protein
MRGGSLLGRNGGDGGEKNKQVEILAHMVHPGSELEGKRITGTPL